MNNDLVSRSALISEFEWVKSAVNESSKDEVEEAIQRIRNTPAVEAIPAVHARWVEVEVDGFNFAVNPHAGTLCTVPGKQKRLACSHCKKADSKNSRDCKFCPFCGAIMDLKEN